MACYQEQPPFLFFFFLVFHEMFLMGAKRRVQFMDSFFFFNCFVCIHFEMFEGDWMMVMKCYFTPIIWNVKIFRRVLTCVVEFLIEMFASG